MKPTAQKRLFELQDKLVLKELYNARLYYNLGSYFGNCTNGGNNYEACVITSQNALKDYPYSDNREEFATLIMKSKFELAKMQANTDAARLLVYQAANAVDQGLPYTFLAAEAKLVAAGNASDVTRRCLQLYGGYGFSRDYPIERMMRDAKITEIYEGTSEVQMMVISGQMMR